MTVANYIVPANHAKALDHATVMRDWIAYGLSKLNDGKTHEVGLTIGITDMSTAANLVSAKDQSGAAVVVQHLSTGMVKSTDVTAAPTTHWLYANAGFDLGNTIVRDLNLMALAGLLAKSYLADEPDITSKDPNVKPNHCFRVFFLHTVGDETWRHGYMAYWNSVDKHFMIKQAFPVKI